MAAAKTGTLSNHRSSFPRFCMDQDGMLDFTSEQRALGQVRKKQLGIYQEEILASILTKALRDEDVP